MASLTSSENRSTPVELVNLAANVAECSKERLQGGRGKLSDEIHFLHEEKSLAVKSGRWPCARIEMAFAHAMADLLAHNDVLQGRQAVN